MARVTKTEQEGARQMLVKFVKPGDTLYTQVLRYTDNGVRLVQVFAIYEGRPVRLSGYIAKLCGLRFSADDMAVWLSFDNGAELLAGLGSRLFGDHNAIHQDHL